MSDTKYNSLPDYDLESQVVYETPDPVLNEEPFETLDSRRSSIDNNELSVFEARDIFVTKCSSNQDIPRSWQLRNSVAGDETLSDRIERLKREVEEAQDEANHIKDSDVKTETDRLAGILSDLVIGNDKNSKDLKHFASDRLNLNPPESQMDNIPTSMTKGLSQISLFEERLAYLESILMPSLTVERGIVNSKPIMSTLDDMEKKLELLSSTPQAIESIAKIIDSRQTLSRPTNPGCGVGYIGQSQRDHHSSNGPDSKENEFSVLLESSNTRMINEIYEKLPVVETIEMLLPRVLGRLKSLQIIHADAGASISLTQELDRKLTSMEIEINEWQKSLETLKENFIKAIDASEKNRVDIEDWVKTLEKKVANL